MREPSTFNSSDGRAWTRRDNYKILPRNIVWPLVLLNRVPLGIRGWGTKVAAIQGCWMFSVAGLGIWDDSQPKV